MYCTSGAYNLLYLLGGSVYPKDSDAVLYHCWIPLYLTKEGDKHNSHHKLSPLCELQSTFCSDSAAALACIFADVSIALMNYIHPSLFTQYMVLSTAPQSP
jgi:hypothetical protein